jgi:DNA (cytosine-5)-methyltransferase 1/DNA (cytosine-5)-methyltransferase 3A
MIVLSLFDGMSCGQIALNRIGVKPSKYYAAEIDKYAIQVTQANYPNTIQLGSVTDWRDWDVNWSSIDLVSGGFPCQAWSMAGKQLGDKDERGMLFWVMLDIMKHAKSQNPKIKFLIENVKMKKEFEEYITRHTEQALGEVNKVLINSALVSAQNRNRYYWTNWHVEQPEDKGIVLADIIEQSPDEITVMSEKFTNRNAHILRDDLTGKAKNLSAMEYVKNGRQGDYIKCGAIRGRYLVNGKRADTQVDSMVGITQQRLEVRKDEKTNTLTTVQKDNVVVEKDKQYRKLTPIECERLQCVPDNYTNHVSNTQRYKMLGNGWTVDVIAHILTAIKQDLEKC